MGLNVRGSPALALPILMRFVFASTARECRRGRLVGRGRPRAALSGRSPAAPRQAVATRPGHCPRRCLEQCLRHGAVRLKEPPSGRLYLHLGHRAAQNPDQNSNLPQPYCTAHADSGSHVRGRNLANSWAEVEPTLVCSGLTDRPVRWTCSGTATPPSRPALIRRQIHLKPQGSTSVATRVVASAGGWGR